MRLTLLAALLAATFSFSALAETYYFVDGKQVSRADAVRATLKDPTLEVLKLSVSYTKLNQSTMRLNKERDASLDDIKKAGQ